MFEKFLSEHLNENVIELFIDTFLSNSEEKNFTNPICEIQYKVIMLKYSLKTADIESKCKKVNELITQNNEELKRIIQFFKFDKEVNEDLKEIAELGLKDIFLKEANSLSFLFQWRNKLTKKKDKLSKKMTDKMCKLTKKDFFLKDLSRENDSQQKIPFSFKEIVETFHSIYNKSKIDSVDEIKQNITPINAHLNEHYDNRNKQTIKEQIIEVERLIQDIYKTDIIDAINKLHQKHDRILSLAIEDLQKHFFTLMHLCKRHNKLIKNLKKVVGVQKKSRLNKLKKVQQNINGQDSH